MNLEQALSGWEYWCPACRNRTFNIVLETLTSLKVGEEDGDTKYLSVRVLTCGRCGYPTTLGTYTYYNREKGWDARGSLFTNVRAALIPGASAAAGREPMEYLGFQEPGTTRELHKLTPKAVVASFREAEDSIDRHKAIGAAAAIRNAIRLLVESEALESSDLKKAIKSLKIDKEYLDALGNLKLVGDHTLHYEEYTISELATALNVFHLAISQLYINRDQLRQLHKSVSAKATKRQKEQSSK